MADSQFEELVRDALDELPDWVAPYLEDVAVQIADRADPSEGDLYGLYEGVPVGGDPVGLPPPSITIFREPLERDFGRDPARARAPGAHHGDPRGRPPFRYRRRPPPHARIRLMGYS